MRRLVKYILTELLARFGRQNRTEGQSRLIVLMYHRVIPAGSPLLTSIQPGMYVTSETFAMHMEVLKERFNVVSLREWVVAMKSGQAVPGLSVAITFDDGWQDNYQYAYPILMRAGLPATVFLVSDYIGSNYAFWPDRLIRVLQNYRVLRDSAVIDELDRRLSAAGFVIQDAGFSQESIERIIEFCKANYTDLQMAEWLGNVTDPVPAPAGEQARELLDWSEILDMQAGGLVEFGSHTCSHARLNTMLPVEIQEKEISLSRSRLSQALGNPVDLFCYPNGEYTELAASLVARNYQAAVTTKRGWNTTGSDLRLMRRIGMHDDISNTKKKFLARMSGRI